MTQPPQQSSEASLSYRSFADDGVLDHQAGSVLSLNKPHKHPGNPILYPREEADERYYVGRILWDPRQKKFLMWYQVETVGGASLLRYALSDDGLNWQYPCLGQFVQHGSAANNILADQQGRPICPKCAIFLNPRDDDPERGFVGIFQSWHYYYGCSGDGVHWTVDMEHPVWERGSGDGLGECMSFMYDPVRDVWHAYVRIWLENCTKRVVGHGESHDLRSWSGPKVILEADDSWGFGAQMYAFSAWFDRGLYWGLANIYFTDLHPDPRWRQTMQPALFWSRDALNWRPVEVGQFFISLGQPGDWDGQMIGCGAPIEKDNELQFYYAGYRAKHGNARLNTVEDQRCGMGLALGRPGGYVALRNAGPEEAVLTTKPFRLCGDQLAVNAATAEDGWVKAELIDPSGSIVPTLEIAYDCDPFVGNATDGLVSWHGDTTAMRRVTGETVRVRLRWHNAELFGFRVRKSELNIAQFVDGPKPVRCNRTTRPPVIDGLLNDEVWQDFGAIGVADQFSLYDRTEPAPVASTVYVTRDDDALYFAMNLEEPHTKELVTNCGQIDGQRTLLTDDAIQLELQPDGKGGLVTMVLFNAKGTKGLIRVDPKRGHDFRPDDSPALQVATSVSLGRWEAEVRLPFSVIGVKPPAAEDTWKFNIHRFRQAGQEAREVYSWVCTFGELLRHDKRGQLRFG